MPALTHFLLSSAGTDSFFAFAFFVKLLQTFWIGSTRMHKSSNFSFKCDSLKFVPFVTSHRCQLTSHDVGLSFIHQKRCLQKVQSTQKIHSTKSTIHTRSIHRRPCFGCDDEQVRQSNVGMVTSTFVSFVFAKRFIELEALFLQTQNSFEELEYGRCEPWAGLKCTSDTADSCSQMLEK